MLDCYNREINYLRISVTDRCNLRCTYCMPEEGVKLLNHADVLTFEEILAVVHEAVSMGVTKVRITGGEPLVRRGIVSLVEMIATVKGITDLGLTTNGQLLEEYAAGLIRAGLKRINISLDTLDPVKYSQITRGGELDRVIRGIESAKTVGLHPIKINCVVRNSSYEPDAEEVRAFGIKHGLEVRFIHEMSLAGGRFTIVENGHGGDCRNCNRLRLTADGMIRPCLFSDLQYSIRELGITAALHAALGNKPEKGSTSNSGNFYSIGG